jgi:hypothetical protein
VAQGVALCGIASSVLYGLMIWAIRYEGYNVFSQVPSELTAIGAPTRVLWAQLGWVYTMLVTAFGIGLWKSAGRNRAVRIVGGLILAFASLGLLWPFAAMHQREVLAAGGGTLSDTLHVVLGAVTVFLMFSRSVWRDGIRTTFRFYSIVTIVVLLTFGALTFIEAPRLQTNLPTPWIGLWERINISVFLYGSWRWPPCCGGPAIPKVKRGTSPWELRHETIARRGTWCGGGIPYSVCSSDTDVI